VDRKHHADWIKQGQRRMELERMSEEDMTGCLKEGAESLVGLC